MKQNFAYSEKLLKYMCVFLSVLIVFLSHLEIAKDVTKEILCWSLIETRQSCVVLGVTLSCLNKIQCNNLKL